MEGKVIAGRFKDFVESEESVREWMVTEGKHLERHVIGVEGPTYIDVLDSGSLEIKEKTEEGIKLMIGGNVLKGEYDFHFTGSMEELTKEDWCTSQGGNWVTMAGGHVCVGIKDNLEFRGSAPHQESKIRFALSKLPSQDKQGFKRIYVRSQLELSGYAATFKQDVDGTSSMFVAKETLDGDDWKEFSEHVVSHEVGHNVFRTKLDADQSSDWRAFFYANKDSFPTAHSQISPDEGFAEAYSNYQTDRELDSKIRSKIEGMGVKKP